MAARKTVSLDAVRQEMRRGPVYPDYASMPVAGVMMSDDPWSAEIVRHIERYGDDRRILPADMRRIARLREWAETDGLPFSERYLHALWNAYRGASQASRMLGACVRRVATIRDVST